MYNPSSKVHSLSFKVVVFTACGILMLAAFALAGQPPPAALAQGADEFFVTSFYTGFGWMLNAVPLDRFAFVPTSGAACYTTGTCYKIVWRQPQPSEFVGMYWVHPQAGVGDWSQPGQPGCNLTGATSITFWARGEQGGEKISWLAAFYALDEIETAPTTLTTAWAPYSIDLAGHDLTNVVGAFGYRVWGSINPTDTTFYIDRIAYQGITAAQLACTQNATPVVTPVVTPPPDAPLVLVYAVLDNNLYDGDARNNWDYLINILEAGVHTGIRVRLLIDARGTGNSYVYDLKPDKLSKLCPNILDMRCGTRYVDGVSRIPWTENTAEPASLYEFIKQSVERYPDSSRIVLSLIGHGNGWSANALPSLPTRWSDQSGQPNEERIGGVLWDDNPDDSPTGAGNNTRAMSTQALGVALSQAVLTIGRKFDLIYLDACSMGMAEVAYELRHTADYLLASPNTIWTSFPYDRLLEKVEAGRTGRDLGKAWFDVEVQAFRNNPNHPFTLSLVNLTKMGQLLTAANTLASALTTALPAQRMLIEQSAAAADRFESNYDGALDVNDAYADLYSFSTQLLKRFAEDSPIGQAAANMQSTVSDVVEVKSSKSGNPAKPEWSMYFWDWQDYEGLAIYLPIPVDDPIKRLLYTMANLDWAADSGWDEFLATYWAQGGGIANSANTVAPTCNSTLECTGLLARPLELEPDKVFIPFAQR